MHNCFLLDIFERHILAMDALIIASNYKIWQDFKIDL